MSWIECSGKDVDDMQINHRVQSITSIITILSKYLRST